MAKKRARRATAPRRLNLVVRKPNVVGMIAHDQALIQRNARMLAESVPSQHATGAKKIDAPVERIERDKDGIETVTVRYEVFRANRDRYFQMSREGKRVIAVDDTGTERVVYAPCLDIDPADLLA